MDHIGVIRADSTRNRLCQQSDQCTAVGVGEGEGRKLVCLGERVGLGSGSPGLGKDTKDR